MKRTGKTLTLSGTLPQKLFYSQLFRDPHPILEYSNVLDLTKAWKIKEVKCWLKSSVDEMGLAADSNINFRYTLATDDIASDQDWYAAGDNRAIAWGTVGYDCTQSGTGKETSFTGAGTTQRTNAVYLREDHVIQNRLLIGYEGIGPQSVVEGATIFYELNYLVELEEYVITPVESIIFGIKAIGQNQTT